MTGNQTRKRSRGNGEGGVWFEAARGRWVGAATTGYEDVIDADGNPVMGKDNRPRQRQLRRKVSAKTKSEALRLLREVQAAAEEGRELARRDVTVDRFLTAWLEDVLPGTVTRGTETNYGNVVRLYLRPLLGQKRLRNLTVRDVRVMLQALEAGWTAPDGSHRTPVSPNTRRLARSVLRRALRWAEAEGMVARNVAALADGVRVGTPEGRSLTPEQARALFASLEGHRLAAAYSVALSLGLRRGELLGLAWDDLNLDAEPPRLTVRRALKRHPDGLHLEETKTKQSRRTVHLPAPVAVALRAHRKAQLEERLALGDLWPAKPLGADLVFRSPIGTALDPDNFRNLTYKVTEGAGIGRWSPHELRHSAASLLMAQGVPLKVISELLGHSSIRVTADVYSHLGEPAKAEAADAMTAALWGAS